MLIVITCAWAVSAAAKAQDAPLDLRPRFVTGAVTRYEFWSQRSEATTTRFGPKERRLEVRYTFNGQITWRVEQARPDGSADCAMTFDWFSVEISAEGKSRTADSRKGSSDWEGGHKFVKALVGKPLTVRVAPDGVIQKVDGVKAITAAMEGEEKDKPDENDFKENASGLAVLWGVPAALHVGASWPAAFTWNHEMGKLHYKTRYTLNDTGDLAGVPTALVSSESKLKMTFDDPGLPPGAPPVSMKLDSGSEYEQVIFDLTRREAVARNTTQSLRITSTIRLTQGTLIHVRDETMQAQVVRIAEK